LKGQGAPSLQGTYVGDEIVNVEVVIPKRISNSQKEILKKFEDEAGKGIMNKIFK